MISCLNHLCEIVPPVSILGVLQEVSVAQAVSLCIVDACIEGLDLKEKTPWNQDMDV